MAVWVSYSRVNTDNDHLPTRFDADTDSVFVGFDILPHENLVTGVALGFENTEVATSFNAGKQDIDAFTIAPYAGFLLTNNFSIDASFGYTDSDIDQFRLDSTNLTSIINGDTDSDRWFVSGNLNYFKRFNQWLFNGRLGVVYADEDIDAVVETGGPDAFTSPKRTLKFGQFQVAGELAYVAMEIEPYVMLMYENDFEREDVLLNSAQPAPDNDDDSFRAGLGFRYFPTNDLSLQLHWDWQLSRNDFDSNSLLITGRLEF